MLSWSLRVALFALPADSFRVHHSDQTSLEKHDDANVTGTEKGAHSSWPVQASGSATDVSYSHDDALAHFNFAQATFCDEDVLRRWECGTACKEAPVVSGSVRLLGPGKEFQVRGIVAMLPEDHHGISHEHSLRCVVGFRGSVDIQNWFADARLFPIEWPEPFGTFHHSCQGCLVHSGIAEAYAELEPQMNAALAELGCQTAEVVGHSLGAGVATLAAFRIRSVLAMRVDSVYLFGAPRVGNDEFASTFGALAANQGVDPPAWRIVHYKDPVPRLWPRNLFYSYVHVSREVYYSWDETSYRVCSNSSLDPQCSSEYGLSDCLPRIPYHLTYFNRSLQVRLMDPQCVGVQKVEPTEMVTKLVDVAGRFGRFTRPGAMCDDTSGWERITEALECEEAVAAVASAEALAAAAHHELRRNDTAVVNDASQLRGCHAVCSDEGVCSLVVNQFHGHGSGPKPLETEHVYCKTRTGLAVTLQEGAGWMQWWAGSEEGGAHVAATLDLDEPGQQLEWNVSRSHNNSRWAQGFAAWENSLDLNIAGWR